MLDFELLDDGTQLVSGNSLLGAAVGGLAFGGVGAIVGAGIPSKSIKKGKCTSLAIKLVLNNVNDNTRYINFIGNTTDALEASRESSTYKNRFAAAQECLSLLTIILHKNQHSTLSQQGSTPHLYTEEAITEIRKYKVLYDEGILTEEEFTAKKKQILGI